MVTRVLLFEPQSRRFRLHLRIVAGTECMPILRKKADFNNEKDIF